MTAYSSLFTGKTSTPQAPASHLTPPKYRLLLVDDEIGIVKALARSPQQPVLFCAPGNPGIARDATCLPDLDPVDVTAVTAKAPT